MSHHAGLAHLDLPLSQVAIVDLQGDLLGRAHAREETELRIVALGLAKSWWIAAMMVVNGSGGSRSFFPMRKHLPIVPKLL
jgi:hypothetical protein